jgi:hypothetical protein
MVQVAQLSCPASSITEGAQGFTTAGQPYAAAYITDKNCSIDAHLQELCASAEVACIELIRHIPANGAKLAPLLHYAVQEAHHEQQLPPLLPARRHEEIQKQENLSDSA